MLRVERRCVPGLVSGLSEPAQVAEGGGSLLGPGRCSGWEWYRLLWGSLCPTLA